MMYFKLCSFIMFDRCMVVRNLLEVIVFIVFFLNICRINRELGIVVNKVLVYRE